MPASRIPTAPAEGLRSNRPRRSHRGHPPVPNARADADKITDGRAAEMKSSEAIRASDAQGTPRALPATTALHLLM